MLLSSVEPEATPFWIISHGLYQREPFIMSFAEKSDNATKEEWVNRLENAHIQRSDMNKLIMNYLVTGKF